MDRIRALLALLVAPDGLTHEELVQARVDLAEAFEEFAATPEALSDEGMALVDEADQRAQAVDELIAAREAELAQREETLAAVRARLAPVAETPTEPETPDGGEGDGEGETQPEGETEPAQAEVVVDEPAPEAIAASDRARTPVPLAVLNRTQPLSTRPRAEVDQHGSPILTAAPDLPNVAAGAHINWEQAAEAMTQRLDQHRMANDPAMPPVIMRAGRLSWANQFQEDRKVHTGDAEGNERKITGVIGDFPGDTRVLSPRDGNGLTASGGLCAPVTVRYELETLSVANRPLRDGLPSFNADRGGIQFNSPAHLVDVLADTTSAALTTTTVANDVSATTKTVQEIACGALQTVQVRAIAERLQFSNFADRYNPERMRQWMQLARAAHSRLAERELLEDIRAASSLVSGGVVELGAARNWVGTIKAAAAAMRYRHRMDDTYPLRVIVPEWWAVVVEVDLLKQAPGDGIINNPIEGETWINSQLSDDNIRPIYQRDDARTNNALGAGAPSFTAQTGSGATLQDFPGRLESILFPEGSFLFLDGGTLDFGIVRDSTLNAANRFQTFYEVFEAVAFVGVESLDIVSAVCASGAAAALVAGKCGGIGS